MKQRDAKVGSASSVVEAVKVSSKPKALSLFSGAGGMDRGFVDAGFEIKAAVEISKSACDTFRANFPDTQMFDGDIADPDLKSKVVGMLRNSGIDVVFGGIPCTGFSLRGRRDPKAACNYLYRDYLDLVGKTCPKVFCIENVEGILSMPMRDGSLAIEAIKAVAAGIGYKVEHKVLCAADHGVPQMRKRVIIIGTRWDVPILFPEPTHGPKGSGLKPYATVKEAIGDLQDKDEDVAFGHVFTGHSAELMGRIKAVKPGQTLYSRNHGYRLTPDGQAATLTNNNGSTVLHYALDRMITPRECARIQGFPDAHQFSGSRNEMGKQVANALPPPVAEKVAGMILKMLDAIEAGAPELSPSVLVPAPVTPAPDAEALKDWVATDRKACVGRINVEKQKIDAAEGRVDSFYLRMGKFIDEHVRTARALGETRGDDYLLKALAKDPACKVKQGALYNSWTYQVAHSQMEEEFGRAPDVPMTYFVKVRHKALTLDERHGLLLKAEAAKGITASRLNALVAGMLKDKGVGRKDPAPDAELLAFCNKAFTAVTKIAGSMKKGIKVSEESFLLMDKTAAMLARCLKNRGFRSADPIPAPIDVSEMRRAS